MRVLVAVEGDDARVAATGSIIAECLTEHGATVEVAHIGELHDVHAHDATVLGATGVADGWSAVAADAVGAHAGALVRLPVWLFSVRDREGTDHRRPAASVDAIARMTDAEAHRVFHPLPTGTPADGEVRGWADGIATALGCTPGVPASASAAVRESERVSQRPSHAKGRWFWTVMIAVWPVALALALLGWAVAGGQVMFWIASALAVAFVVDILVPQFAVEVDDGEEDRTPAGGPR
jgi:hypothetical protein